MKLLLSQKDEIFEIIKNFELFSPIQFELIEDLGNSMTILQFKKSEYYFKFLSNNQGYWANYSPGWEKILDATDYLNWTQSKEHLFDWLVCLKRELITPNHWENFKSQLSGISFKTQYDNEKFSYKEFEDLEMQIDLLKDKLESIPLLVEQNIEIKNHLDRLTESAKDLGKFDWKNLFIGTILSIIIQLNVTPENATALWELIKNTFNQYFLE